MPKKPVVVGELYFNTKSEAKAHFSKILNKYPLDTELISSDFEAVMSLLLCHPRVDKKLGYGVKLIKIAQGYSSKNRCFHIIRIDDSIEDFSIGKCIDGDHSAFHKFCIAARRAVEIDIRPFKKEYFEEHGNSEGKIKCPITKEEITFDEAHVDHKEPSTFSSIVHSFIKENNFDLGSVEYMTEGKYGNEFKNNELTEKFRNWHRKTAKIRIIKDKANLAKSYLGRIPNNKADNTLT